MGKYKTQRDYSQYEAMLNPHTTFQQLEMTTHFLPVVDF